jgi:hypothetical protein
VVFVVVYLFLFCFVLFDVLFCLKTGLCSPGQPPTLNPPSSVCTTTPSFFQSFIRNQIEKLDLEEHFREDGHPVFYSFRWRVMEGLENTVANFWSRERGGGRGRRGRTDMRPMNKQDNFRE